MSLVVFANHPLGSEQAVHACSTLLCILSSSVSIINALLSTHPLKKKYLNLIDAGIIICASRLVIRS